MPLEGSATYTVYVAIYSPDMLVDPTVLKSGNTVVVLVQTQCVLVGSHHEDVMNSTSFLE